MLNYSVAELRVIIFYKKNIILDLFLRNLDILVTFARKALLGMKIQEVMK